TSQKSIVSDTSHSSVSSKLKTIYRKISQRKTTKQPSLRSPKPLKVENHFGLIKLHEPNDTTSVIADIIFIHGLGGGSSTTWAHDSDPDYFWPHKWLPHDGAFEGVAIHSFGYDADFTARNPNFKSKNVQPLNVDTYGQSLVEDLYNHPTIKNRATPLIFVAHSMGGLVLKKACIVLQTDPRYSDIRPRLHSFYFLGTPHRGAELADILGNILLLSVGNKSYVQALRPHSDLIASLHDQFRHHYDGIQIHTFYETKPVVSMGFRSIVVDKESATLGYKEEVPQLLNADHINLTKFTSKDDANYRTVRNKLAKTMDGIRQMNNTQIGASSSMRPESKSIKVQLDTLRTYLGIETDPADALSKIPDTRVAGSCSWLTNSVSYKSWLDSLSPRYFWLEGAPGAGKTMLTTHVIEELREAPACYYFFEGGESSLSNLGSFLSSMAYQMALVNPDVRVALLGLVQQGIKLTTRNFRSLWQSVFVGCIFHQKFKETHYWIMDALDEFVDGGPVDEYFSIISKIDENIPLKVFVTSRPSKSLSNLFGNLPVIIKHIEPEDCLADIRLYVQRQSHGLPASDDNDRQVLIEKVVEQSGSSFLWTKLVMKELQDVNTTEEIGAVLSEVPQEFRKLYIRDVSRLLLSNSKALAKIMLTWAMCAKQPLTVDEMKEVVSLAGMTLVRDLSRDLQHLCGQFLEIDKFGRIQVAHSTARVFLISEDCDQYFRMDSGTSNLAVALACLQHLSDEAYARRRTRAMQSPVELPKPFVTTYACVNFTYHLSRASPTSHELYEAVSSFFHKRLLFWIEKLARLRRLDSVVRAAKHLSRYLNTLSIHPYVIQDDLSQWVVDLPRLVTQFGASLSENPAAIHTLMTPFCPHSSAIYKKYGQDHNGIELIGSWTVAWDDRTGSILYRERQPTALACMDRHFAVGLENGSIMLYKTATCEEYANMMHGESVKILRFSNSSKFLAAASLNRLSLWDVATKTQLWNISIKSRTLSLAFREDESQLMAATEAEVLSMWRTSSTHLDKELSWQSTKLDDGQANMPKTPPQGVKMSIEQNIVAVVYKSRPLQLWSIDPWKPLGLCVRPHEQMQRSSGQAIHAVTLNPDPSLSLVAVAYWDGTMILYSTKTRKELKSVDALVHRLCSSPNGRILAGSDNDGGINLYDFESLQLIHRVRPREDPAIDLVFTSDNLHIIDVRVSQLNLWEPAVLASRDIDSNSSEPAGSLCPLDDNATLVRAEDLAIITALRCCNETRLAFCGRSNGNVDVCSLNGPVKTLQPLYKHQGTSKTITKIEWNLTAKILVSADSSGTFRVMQLASSSGGIWSAKLLFRDQLGPGVPINQMVIQPDGSKLLVSSPEADSTWSIREKQIVAYHERHERHETHSWKWLIDLSDESRLILVEDSTLSLHSWANLDALPMSLEPPSLASEQTHDRLDVDSVSIISKSNNLVFTHNSQLSHGPGESNSTRISVLDLSLLSNNISSKLPSTPSLVRHIADIPNIEMTLGTLRKSDSSYLLFISTTGWICSVKLDDTPSAGDIQKYFFIPSIWRSGNSGMRARIMKDHSIVFVHNEEIVVVRDGLENPFFEDS
ncbi:WD40 repeat-like protein, partial [Aureobasidium pullulans]